MATATDVQVRQRPWWLTLIGGVAAVILGGLLLWGGLGVRVQVYMLVVYFIGFYWFVSGIFELVYMFVDHSMWGWKLFMGIVGIWAGGYVITNPILSAVALPKIAVLVLGIYGIMYGIILIVMAFKGGGWGAGLLGALGLDPWLRAGGQLLHAWCRARLCLGFRAIRFHLWNCSHCAFVPAAQAFQSIVSLSTKKRTRIPGFFFYVEAGTSQTGFSATFAAGFPRDEETNIPTRATPAATRNP